MLLGFDTEDKKMALEKLQYLVGSAAVLNNMHKVSARKPFDDEVIDFLDALSKELMGMTETKAYPDIITLAFWIRRSSVMKLKDRFLDDKVSIYRGRGVAFHIAPSNVAVNYMYSLVVGLLTGNANVVRLPSKLFPQVDIINNAINRVLEHFEDIKTYICLVRYERDRNVNDLLSAMADTRIVWGGDRTITELRQSPLKPRATEVTFADRYSIAVIDSNKYMDMSDKEKFAEAFYNDTYLTDQNACTSPRLVVWTGEKKREAKEMFWTLEHELVKKKYQLQPIMGINKLTSGYLMAMQLDGTKIEPQEDNYICRVKVSGLDEHTMEFKDNSGYFMEYDCNDIMELYPVCNDTRCQTIGYLGEKEDIMPLILSGIHGVDRVVPIGKTMDFDLIWDGYNLVESLSRRISVNI